MKYSVVINQYKRTNFVDRAIQSCQSLIKEPDDTIEIIVVSDFPIKNVDKNILCNVASVGYRYAQGLKEATGDWIFLLDDDDYMRKDRLKSYSEDVLKENIAGYKVDRYNVIKEARLSYLKKTLSMKRIIKKHVDWHISEYSFNKTFRDKLLEKGIEDVDASLDKFIFSIALEQKHLFLTRVKSKVHIEKHRDSKMSSMNKNDKTIFYARTAQIFTKAFMDEKILQNDYTIYCVNLNMFLATKKKDYFDKAKQFMPLVNRLYYGFVYSRRD